MSERPLRVCLMLEGSYPFITGGVSAWVHDIVNSLSEVDFCLFTISPSADQPLRYKLPPNMKDHVDVVLTQTPRNQKKHPDKEPLFRTLQEIHETMKTASVPDFGPLIEQLPEGYFLHQDSLKREDAWDLIVRSNQEQNPVYSFSDYFWAWRSAHAMMFTILGTKPPEADIYHAVSTGFAGLAALAAQVRHKKALLLTEHGLYHKEREIEIRKAAFVHGYQRDMWTKIYNRLSQVCYKKADLVTALFEENRQKQIALGADPARAEVVPNGIDIERFSSVVRMNRPGFHVGLVGRVVPIKDIKTFIVTAKIILDEMPDAVFHCIGPTDEDPEYYQDCARLVESLKIQDRFHFTGRQNVLDYYAFLDVMLLTSIREAQPLVILEAWCGGVPVVSTRVGNVPEMLDYDDRFLANSKDSEKLAAGIRWIRSHPEEMKSIMEKNLQKTVSFYNKKDLMGKVRSIYHRLKGVADGRNRV